MNFIILDLLNGNHVRQPEESMSYKFGSNSQKFDIIYEVSNIKKGFFPHIGITAREGICVMYRPADTKNWYNIDFFLKEDKVTIDMSSYVEKDELYEILIYAPIIASLSKLQIEFPDNVIANEIPQKLDRTILVAGGPISYGIGCTTVQSMFSNILERKFDAHVYHPSYNSNIYLKKVYEYYMDNPPIVDVGIIELDYFIQKESLIEEVLPEVISLMKRKCRYLFGWYAIHPLKSYKKVIANNTIREFIYNKDIEIIDFSYLFDEEYSDMCVYNHHVNDSANMIIYKELEEKIRGCVEWNI